MISNCLTDDIRRKLNSVFDGRGICLLQSMPPAAGAFLAWVLREVFQRTVVMIADNARSQDMMTRNLAAFAENGEPFLLAFPAWDSPPSGENRCAIGIVGERMTALNRLARCREPFLVATCLQALRQMTLSREAIACNTIRLALEQKHEPDALLSRLELAGYEFAPETQEKGQAAWRGGILDIWPPGEEMPFRVEFFGATVETIRSFNPDDQRSLERKDEIVVTPANEWKLMRADRGSRSPFMSHLDRDVIYFWFDCGQEGLLSCLLSMAGRSDGATRSPTPIASDPRADGRVAQKNAPSKAAEGDLESQFVIPLNDAARMIAGDPRASQCISSGMWAAQAPETDSKIVDLGFRMVPAPAVATRGLFEPDLLAEHRRTLLGNLAEMEREGVCVHIFFGARGALDRFAETQPWARFQLHQGVISDGFVNASMRIGVVGESMLTGQPKQPRERCSIERRGAARRRGGGRTITDWTSITPGDLVVHVDHGIGKYLGIREIVFDGRPRETLAVEYADDAKLYVPASHAHLLSRYVGAGRRPVRLHRLGGARWTRERRAAERAVEDLASSMLQLQAMRESMAGFAFPPDAEWQHDFEAAFPYEETPDQSSAIEQAKADMESARPMDRLVCGDVGYGKTEVALRAAFKAVAAGKQVALLVPTTVLAQQHFEVFVERMGAYPFNIEMLCRFRSRAQQEAAVRGLGDGSVDIAIGTHRLLQNDVKFKDLGLVIIDEEQRFGVAHKERLKHMRQLVDVLTLTATPIPRTLYMSMVGARDISMIQTPPQARLPVETVVAPREDEIVRRAIRLELERGGQIYYLHNRISTIERVRQWLQSLAPEARIAVGHGQIPTGELSFMMREFERGAFDLLLCTTIIQSGLDIPNVNTILIDRADRFGMADLHQLRGRVGRSSRKAYAYMLLPAHGRIMADSEQRIQAIIHHSDLGSGFQLALRDLEIRGAGNLLGRDQSGHIAAVGFDLYCQLLKRTVAQLSRGQGKGEPLPRIVDVELNLDFISLSSSAADTESAACVPDSYVEDEQLRLSVYRKIASATATEEIRELKEEFRDRFGPVPAELELLLKMAALRIVAASKTVTSIETVGDKVKIKKDSDYFMPGRRFPRLRSTRAGDRIDEMVGLLNRMNGAS